MQRCKECSWENDDNENFCANCGIPLNNNKGIKIMKKIESRIQCDSCGKINVNTNVCKFCGNKLPEIDVESIEKMIHGFTNRRFVDSGIIRATGSFTVMKKSAGPVKINVAKRIGGKGYQFGEKTSSGEIPRKIKMSGNKMVSIPVKYPDSETLQEDAIIRYKTKPWQIWIILIFAILLLAILVAIAI